jgi:ketosteroid isomerase-like protein
MRVFASSILLDMCLAGPVHSIGRAAVVAHQTDVAAIRRVVEQFKTAIVARDGKTLGNLFLQDHDRWLSVADEPTWAAVKARKMRPPTWKKFAEFVQTARAPIEERFYDVRIETNGAVASVWFDFDFLIDGQVTNRGSESWQMVRAEDGWKISSILYSMGR